MVKEVMKKAEMEGAINILARDALKAMGEKNLTIVGIRNRGAILAERIAKKIEKNRKTEIPFGALDITLYRDDLSAIGPQPIVHRTEIPFDLTGKKVLLIDDVLYTGRTIRAALDELIDFGRPAVIKLLVLIDRNNRELPIQPDFVGKKVIVQKNEMVEVKLKESDGKEQVIIVKK